MKVSLILLYMFFIMGCKFQNTSILTSVQKQSIMETFVHSDTLRPKFLHKSIDTIQIKSYFIGEILKGFNTSPLIDSIKIKKYANFGKSRLELYALELPFGFPNNIEKNYTICVFENSSIYFLPLSIVINVNFISNNYTVIGLSEVREFEYIIVYSISDKYAYKEFDSSYAYNSKGLYVSYYKDDECYDFISDRSKFDTLNNGVNFTNTIKNNCLENEQISSFELNIKLFYGDNSKKWTFIDGNGNAELIFNK